MAEQPAGGGDDLKLACALVDVGHADVPEVPLDVELAHVPGSTLDLHGLIADPVAHFGGVVLGQRGENGRHAIGVFESLAALWGQLTLRFQVLVGPLDVDPASGLVDHGPGGLDLAAHGEQHAEHGGDGADRLSELDPLLGVPVGLPVGRLGDAHGLSGHRDAGAVHQGPGVTHQAIASLPHQAGGRVVELHLTSG